MTSGWTVGGFGDRPSLRWPNVRLVVRRPRLIPKLIRCYARVARGRRVLRGVEFAITYRCNFNCPHCLKTDVESPERPELTADEIVAAAAQIEKLGGIFVNLTGGEPILREDIFEIVARASRLPGLLVTLASNGFALDEEKLARLAANGLSMLALSLDGASPETHDAFRGTAGSFARVLAATEAAQRRGLVVWLTAVATEESLGSGEIARLAELARGLGCSLTLNLPYDVGRWRGHDVAVSPAAYQAYLALLRLPHVRWEGASNWRREGCPAGVEKLYITPYGDVFPCAVLQTSYGNLREQSLPAIYQALAARPEFRTCDKPCLVAEASLANAAPAAARRAAATRA